MDELINVRELYEKAKKYLEEEYKNDPETDPFRSKYKALNYLKTVKEKIDGLLVDRSDCTNFRSMLAVVLLQMGMLSVDTEELSSGEVYLNEALFQCSQESNGPRFLLVAITARNQLGILWCHRGDHERAKNYLDEAENIFLQFEAEGKAEEVLSLHEHFDEVTETQGSKGLEVMEREHTLTKFYLAQVYGKLGEPMKSAIYCHETLRRQLESKQYDPVDWALNAATLSQYFMERKLYSQARHHLASSSYVLDSYQDQLKTMDIPEEEMEAKRDELRHREADVSRCWAKLGIFILEQSKDSDGVMECPESLQKLWFSTLEVTSYENQMTDELVSDFEAARDVMLVTQKYLLSAREYYTLEDHASDYVQIVQDHSSLLRHLSWFEKDETRLSKMYRKRINMLDEVLKELDSQYYLQACRAMWFELGEAYHDLMQIKQTRVQKNTTLPNPSALVKINQLAEHSIRNFNLFLESARDKQRKLPEPLPEDLLRPILVAHFYLGRLHYKLVSPDKRQILKNTYDAFSSFKYLVDYCNTHPKGMSAVIEEYQVSEQMVHLLELKIKQSVNLIA